MGLVREPDRGGAGPRAARPLRAALSERAVLGLRAIPIPRCVASSADHERLRKALHPTRLLPYFEGRIFSATDVERGKPAPDLFVHAARSLGASPERCAVIEDSAPGVAAALAARMMPFGFAGTSTADEAELEAEGARLFWHMRELPDLLDGAGAELSSRSPVSPC